jgi:hypothetical protein
MCLCAFARLWVLYDDACPAHFTARSRSKSFAVIFQEVGDKICVGIDHSTHSVAFVDGDRVSNFVFDQVYDQNSSQEELFNEAVVPIVCIRAAHGCDVFECPLVRCIGCSQPCTTSKCSDD